MKKDKEQIEQRNRQLREWACNYHSASFIESDPVQFPHRYVLKQDIEISGLLTAILSFGNRQQILKKADQLDEMMGHAALCVVGMLEGRFQGRRQAQLLPHVVVCGIPGIS